MISLRADHRQGLILLGLLALAACSSPDSTQEQQEQFRALAEASDYEEIEQRIQVLESQGERSAFLDYWMGIALLSQNEDQPATARLSQAVVADSSLALEVASHYRAAALRDLGAGWRGRGSERMKRAYLLDGITDMQGLEPEVADLLFDEKSYRECIPVYRYLLAGEEHSQAQRWWLRLGLAQEQIGLREAALEQYRGYWGRFESQRSGVYATNVRWRQGILLLDFADERMAHGDCAGAISLLDELLELRPTADQLATAYYRKGLCLEDLLRLEEARENYRLVLEIPAGEGGRVQHEARQRLRETADR